jgi:predicted lipoprotein with Yx(FWY)xxD motif
MVYFKHIFPVAAMLAVRACIEISAAASEIQGMLTPPGITLQNQIANETGYAENVDVRFGDAEGITLYRRTNRQPCDAKCLEGWRPALAGSSSSRAVNWAIVSLGNGKKQWSYEGRLLYRSAKDLQWGELNGSGAGWEVARPEPGKFVLRPNIIAVRESELLSGFVLIDATRGRLIYSFAGDPRKDNAGCLNKACAQRFVALQAPQSAHPVGGFTILARRDGVSQWAYKNKGLYTYSEDSDVSDANGKDLDLRFQPVIVARYFLPSSVVIHPSRIGGVLTTTDNRTLYARDAVRLPPLGTHSARGGTMGLTSLGRKIGRDGCNAECETKFPPFLAPTGAQPSGYWSLVDRGDAKQWAYKGYALYTSVMDKNPGDMLAHDEYDLKAVNTDLDAAKDLPKEWHAGLYWRAAIP